MNVETYDEVISSIQMAVSDIQFSANCNLNIYVRGSYVYGTYDDESDLDLIVVHGADANVSNLNSTIRAVESAQIVHNTDTQIFTHTEWQQKLSQHDVMAVECFYLDAKFKFEEAFVPQFTLDKSKLRSSFSHVASNSYVKAKKKLTVAEDFDERVAKKSLFHSFRILDLGIQIGSGVMPLDYANSNAILSSLNTMKPDWKSIEHQYKASHNAMHTLFREICPKDVK